MTIATEVVPSQYQYRPENIGPIPHELAGIDTRRTRIGTVRFGDGASELVQNALYYVVGNIDTRLDIASFDLPVDREGTAVPSGLMFRKKFSRERVRTQGSWHDTMVEHALGYIDERGIDAALGFPVSGALPLLHGDLKRDLRGWNKGRGYYPLEIGGSAMVYTGGATVKKDLPVGFKEAPFALVDEDIVDTGISSLQIMYGRVHNANVRNLIILIQDKRKEGATFPDLQEEYRETARLARETRTAFFYRYCKNTPLWYALQEQIDKSAGESDWKVIQSAGLAGAELVPEHEWVMGADGLLDTRVDFLPTKPGDPCMMDYIPSAYHNRIQSEGYTKHYLRIGAGIRDLVVLDPSRQNDLVRLAAQETTNLLIREEEKDMVTV